MILGLLFRDAWGGAEAALLLLVWGGQSCLLREQNPRDGNFLPLSRSPHPHVLGTSPRATMELCYASQGRPLAVALLARCQITSLPAARGLPEPRVRLIALQTSTTTRITTLARTAAPEEPERGSHRDPKKHLTGAAL